MANYLVTYRPLIFSRGGREAAQQFGLPHFIDGSCRREPDFEAVYPSITATCRAGKFAPKLQVGDLAVYISRKGAYDDDRVPGWRMTAALRVVRRFPDHESAAAWHAERELGLPSNCIASGNPPKPLHMTNREPPDSVVALLAKHGSSDPERAVRLWDATYRARIRQWPVFLLCEAEFLEIHHPPQLSSSDLHDVFGRVPGTQNPPAITDAQARELLRRARSAMPGFGGHAVREFRPDPA